MAPRLAWFTPWPPQRSGVAGRSVEAIRELAARGYGVDVFVDEQLVPLDPLRLPADAPAAGSVRVQTAHDFLWRHARRQYDLVVYQLGNSAQHAFIWPYVFQYPGLVVLHDLRLHHARGRALLSKKRVDDYRAEFAWNHPDDSADAAELGVKGFDGSYYYQWPMVREIVESARLVATHAVAGPEWEDAWPDQTIAQIALGDGIRDEGRRQQAEGRSEWRRSVGLAPDALVFGVFGALTAEKRIGPIVRAFAAIHRSVADAHLVLAGVADKHLNVQELAHELGVDTVVHLLGELDDTTFDRAIASVDVSLHLRWPTAVETSGPWLLALSAARPTVITDLAHLASVPTLDARTWRCHQPEWSPGSSDPGTDAVAVAIDILDEDHSLRLALQRLAVDPALRAQLGRAGHDWWRHRHTLTHMVDDYEKAIAQAIQSPSPSVSLPGHLRPEPERHSRSLIQEVQGDRRG
jgi:glycosyltransferase involved in cell wall biosynthesis